MGGIKMSKITTLKKKIILILSVLVVGLFMTAGLTFTAEAGGLSVTSEQFKMKGASVRYVDATHGPGVKFHVLLNKGVFDGLSDSAKTGLKLCPEKLLGGETLASSTNANIVDIETRKSDWKASDTDENMMELTVYVYDIPAANYGTDIKVAGYVTDGGKTVYTEAVNDTYSLAYVAKAAAGVVQDADKISQLEGYYKFKFKAYDLNGALVGGEQTAIYGETLTQPTSTSTLTCGWFNKAKTQKWEFGSDVVSGNVSLYETKHNFNDNGVCEYCGTNIKDLFMKSVDSADIKVDTDKGVYNVISTKTNEGHDATTVISGDILKALKDLGYKTLTFNVKNPAGTITADTWKQFRIAADKRENLDKAPIKSYTAPNIWDGADHTVNFTIDLETYAGRDLYIIVDKCKTVPTEIRISEFINYEAPEARLVGGHNGTVEYIKGKGWHAYANSNDGYYYALPAEILSYYIKKGYTSLKISFTNSFNLEGVTTAGNSVNCQAVFLPKKAADGTEDKGYKAGFISQLTRDEANDSYYWVFDLTNTTYDFTKGMRIYNTYSDVGGAAVGHTYINAIEFSKSELPNA